MCGVEVMEGCRCLNQLAAGPQKGDRWGQGRGSINLAPFPSITRDFAVPFCSSSEGMGLPAWPQNLPKPPRNGLEILE